MGVANERDFYRLKDLNDEDVDWIRKLAINENKNPRIKETHENLLKMYLTPFQILKSLREKGLSDLQFESELDIILNNFEEELHSKIEASAIEILESLQCGDTSFYHDDEKCITFMHYMTTQYFRTNSMKQNYLSVIGSDPLAKRINIDKIWNILSHILSTDLGFSIYCDRSRFRLIKIVNETQVPFITGDQPLFNTYAIGKHNSDPVFNLDFYYPVTPTLAYLLTENPVMTISEIRVNKEADIDSYNKSVVAFSFEQVYSCSAESLQRYC